MSFDPPVPEGLNVPDLPIAPNDGTQEVEPSGDPDDLALEEALEVANRALKRTLSSDTGSVDLDSLEEILEAAGQAMNTSTEARLRALTDSAAPSKVDPRTQREVETRSSWTLDQLTGEISKLEGRVVEQLSLQSLYLPAEELSIVLQMLPQVTGDELREATLERLHAVVQRVSSTELHAVASGALREYLEGASHDLVDRVFPVLARVMQSHPTPWLDQLAAVGRQVSSQAREALWPHLANELLRLRPESASREIDSWLLIDDLPEERVRWSAYNLCELPTLAERCLPEGAFRADQKHSYRLFAALLETTAADYVGPEILHGLHRSPPDIDGVSQVLEGFQAYRSDLAPFLRDVLRASRNGEVRDELFEQCATWLIALLAELEPNRRTEAWVPKAIAFLGRRAEAAAKDVLKNVIRQHSGILPAWPKACRKEAKSALTAIKLTGRFH